MLSHVPSVCNLGLRAHGYPVSEETIRGGGAQDSQVRRSRGKRDIETDGENRSMMKVEKCQTGDKETKTWIEGRGGRGGLETETERQRGGQAG